MSEHYERTVERAEEKETGRLEAFSDGVFAFAITLLAVDLKVPDFASNAGKNPATGHDLLVSLWHEWPSYVAFVTSFFSVLIMWMHHHNIFRWVHRVDSRLMLANGFLLFIVALVPFPTSVVAEYFREPALAPAAACFYSSYFVIVALGFYITLRAAMRSSVVSARMPEVLNARFCYSYQFGPPLYLLAALTAPFSPWASLAICTGLWIFWAAVVRDYAQPGAR